MDVYLSGNHLGKMCNLLKEVFIHRQNVLLLFVHTLLSVFTQNIHDLLFKICTTPNRNSKLNTFKAFIFMWLFASFQVRNNHVLFMTTWPRRFFLCSCHNVDIPEAGAWLKALLAGFSHRCLHGSGQCFDMEVLTPLKCHVYWSSRDIKRTKPLWTDVCGCAGILASFESHFVRKQNRKVMGAFRTITFDLLHPLSDDRRPSRPG